MTLLPVLVFSIAALLIGRVIPARWRVWMIFAGSLASIYWLQPAAPLRNFDFWLPTAAILLVILTWSVCQPVPFRSQYGNKAYWIALAAIALIIFSISLLRYLGPVCCLTATRPPGLERAVVFFAAGSGLALLALFLPKKRLLTAPLVGFILLIFIVLKTPALAAGASSWFRALAGQAPNLAGPADIAWLGFSFLAFRLLHVIFDFRAGKLPHYRLEEFVAYTLFFPAVSAGPIDRIQRFSGDLAEPKRLPDPGTRVGLERVMIGIFKKFVLADTLALVALNGQIASQANSQAWLWVILYAYALRIYFDFSGYTDVAIGIGNLMGFNLPENFDRPYLKSNLTAFWNSWHMSLAQWFRAYYFNPLTRALRLSPRAIPAWLIIFFGQVSTMLLIGIWHGITWNFALWGLWHGAGLFVHNRWSAWIRPRLPASAEQTAWQRLLPLGGWFVTFNFVALGWVWFALPSPKLSVLVFQKLLGLP